jgi:hypothetical protein
LQEQFREYCGSSLHPRLDLFFQGIKDLKVTLVKAQIITRLTRLYEYLADKDRALRIPVIETIISSGPFGHALAQAELTLLKNKDSSEDELVQCVCVGLAEARKLAALSLAHRPDHGGDSAEETVYARIFRDLIFLSLEDVPLNSSSNVSTCMKPKHAALAFFKGDESNPGWANSDTYFNIVYELLRARPELVITWLIKNVDKRIQRVLKQNDTPLEERLWEFAATPDRKEVKQEIIPYLLMHEKLKYLADTSDYE